MAAKLRCFVAMAFGKKDTDAIFSALRKTLGPLGVNAQRVDRIEHNDNIDTRIISEIEAAVTGVCTTPFMCRSDASRSPQRDAALLRIEPTATCVSHDMHRPGRSEKPAVFLYAAPVRLITDRREALRRSSRGHGTKGGARGRPRVEVVRERCPVGAVVSRGGLRARDWERP